MEDKEKSAIELFESILGIHIDESGFYPTPGITVQRDGTMVFLANAIDGDSIIPNAIRTAQQDKDVVEMVVAVDVRIKFGAEFPDALMVFHCRENQETRRGLISYSWNGGNPIIKPIEWNPGGLIDSDKRVIDRLTEVMKRS